MKFSNSYLHSDNFLLYVLQHTVVIREEKFAIFYECDNLQMLL